MHLTVITTCARYDNYDMFGIKLKENTHVLDTYTRKKESLDEIVTRRHGCKTASPIHQAIYI